MIKGDKWESPQFKTACIHNVAVVVILMTVLVLGLRTLKEDVFIVGQHLTTVLLYVLYVLISLAFPDI